MLCVGLLIIESRDSKWVTGPGMTVVLRQLLLRGVGVSRMGRETYGRCMIGRVYSLIGSDRNDITEDQRH